MNQRSRAKSVCQIAHRRKPSGPAAETQSTLAAWPWGHCLARDRSERFSTLVIHLFRTPGSASGCVRCTDHLVVLANTKDDVGVRVSLIEKVIGNAFDIQNAVFKKVLPNQLIALCWTQIVVVSAVAAHVTPR